jgi:hypothetical protein
LTHQPGYDYAGFQDVRWFRFDNLFGFKIAIPAQSYRVVDIHDAIITAGIALVTAISAPMFMSACFSAIWMF